MNSIKRTLLLIWTLTVAVVVSGKAQVDTIIIQSGDHHIYGLYYDGGKSEPMPTLFLLHGFPGGFGDVLGVGSSLSSEGINVVTLTLSGVSISQGEFTDTSPFEDIQNTLDFLFLPESIERYKIDTSMFVMGGWSFGGGLSLYTGATDSRIKAMISIAGFNGQAFLERVEDSPDFRKLMEAVFLSYRLRGMVNFEPQEAINDLQRQEDKLKPVALAGKIAKKPLLLFGATDDNEVDLTHHILPYYKAIRLKGGDVEFHVYQTGHRFDGYLDQLHSDILSWMKSM